MIAALSQGTLQRLPQYLIMLKTEQREGRGSVTAEDIGDVVRVSSSQVRHDLAACGISREPDEPYDPAADDAGNGESGLKYQTSQLTDAAASGEWLTLSIRYKEPSGSESRLQTRVVGEDCVTDAPSGDFLFACAVAEFGMILNDSEYLGDTSYASVLALLKQAPLNDAYREEFFSLVKIAERSDALADD